MKLEEFENFRAEEERLLTPDLGPEEAHKAAQTAYEARLNNLDEEIRDQLRLDIAKAREKRAGITRRYRGMSGVDDEGAPVVCSARII